MHLSSAVPSICCNFIKTLFICCLFFIKLQQKILPKSLKKNTEGTCFPKITAWMPVSLLKICSFRSAVRNFITFLSFIRLCVKFNTFFAFIKLSFLKTLLTSYNVSIIRLLCIPHKTLSGPSIKSTSVFKKVYLD